MSLTLRRFLVISIVVTVVAFLTSGITGNYQSGARAVIGDLAWFVFLVGALVVMALAAATLVQAALRRSRRRDSISPPLISKENS